MAHRFRNGIYKILADGQPANFIMEIDMKIPTIIWYLVKIILWICILLLVVACIPTTMVKNPTVEKVVSQSDSIQEDFTVMTKPIETPTIINSSTHISPTPLTSTTPEQENYKQDIENISSTPTKELRPGIIHSTVSESEATQNLVDLLENNGDCDLPCFWGIVPGKTSVDRIVDNFVHRGFSYGNANPDDNKVSFRSESDQYNGYIIVTFEESGLVQMVEVDGGTTEITEGQNKAWGWYSIQEILKRHGKPDKVFILHPYRYDRDVPASYNLYMLYESLGFLIRYHGPVEYLDDPGMVQACPSITKTDVINLLLYQTQEQLDAIKFVLPEEDIPFEMPGDNVYNAIQWESATGLTLDDFYDLFTKDEGVLPCFGFQSYWLQ